MRRYTAIKSNLYAPVTTNLFAQNMIHDHMVNHYRKTYFAKSQIDTSPPWKYKSRDSYSERVRKKTPKFNPLAEKKEETDSSSDVKCKSVGICHHHFSVNRSPDNKKDFIVQAGVVISGSGRKNNLVANKIGQGDSPCKDMIDVPPLCLTSKKTRQNQQSRNVHSHMKIKKCVCQEKRKVTYGKSKTIPSENILKSHGKTRMQHSHFENYQDNGLCVSSGSEGNAGDDEDGTPTSSCEDLNQSARNSPLSIHNIPIAGAEFSRVCTCSRKFIMENAKQNPCRCHVPIKGAKTAGSVASSRDSAYEGGGIMSSTENQRNSPDNLEKGSKWHQPCISVDYVEKEAVDLNSSNITTQFCSNSELYMKFLQDITDDILLQGVYSNDEEMQIIIQKHIFRNVYNLNEGYMKLMIDKLIEDLGIKPENCNEIERVAKTSDENVLKASSGCFPEKTVPESNVTTFTMASSAMYKNKEIVLPMAKTELQSHEKKKNCMVNIDKNVIMSKEEVMACLTDVGFEDVISEEIFEILAKQHISQEEVPIHSKFC